MAGGDFFYRRFRECFPYEGTTDQDDLFREIADFVTCDDADILVVNGYAGTGKTSAIAAVIRSFDDLRPKRVDKRAAEPEIRQDPPTDEAHRNTVEDAPDEYEEICYLLAPTGRAAKVLSLYAGKPARTIHKCIYRQKSVGDDGFGQFSLAPNKLSHKLFIVDEVSLIGIDDSQRLGTTQFGTGDLLKDLVEYVRAGNDCRLIMIGDSAQLPPVPRQPWRKSIWMALAESVIAASPRLSANRKSLVFYTMPQNCVSLSPLISMETECSLRMNLDCVRTASKMSCG